MTPAFEGDPDVPKVVPKERWYAEPAGRAAAPASHETHRVEPAGS